METPRHPFDHIRIPQTMQRVLDLLRPYEEWETPFELAWQKLRWLFELDIDVVYSCLTFEEPRDRERAASELYYASTPFEIVPVSRNGGDGLHYDWVVHAPERDALDFPMVSFAPGDEGGAVWLGDDTAEGLANLLVGRRLGWALWEQGRPDPALDARWAAIVGAIGREPELDHAAITPGARSARALVPTIPDGYRFEPGPDGIGVLARAEAFGDLDVGHEPTHTISWLWDDAERLHDAGAFAGALVRLKQFRRREPEDRETVERMAACYGGLGREMHVRRARLWLDRH
jgi:hypothetical protein